MERKEKERKKKREEKKSVRYGKGTTCPLHTIYHIFSFFFFLHLSTCKAKLTKEIQ